MPRITMVANTHNKIYSDYKIEQKHNAGIHKEHLDYNSIL